MLKNILRDYIKNLVEKDFLWGLRNIPIRRFTNCGNIQNFKLIENKVPIQFKKKLKLKELFTAKIITNNALKFKLQKM